MDETPRLRASNCKRDVGFLSHVGLHTLVPHLDVGAEPREHPALFHPMGRPSDQSGDPYPTVTADTRGTAQVPDCSEPGDHKGEVIRGLDWVSCICGPSERIPELEMIS